MKKEDLQQVGEEYLKKEKECAQKIINALLNKDNDIETYYDEYKKISDITNMAIDQYFKNKYEIDDDYESKFSYLLLECQDYINLSLIENGNNNSLLNRSKRKVFFASSYLHDQELLKIIWWFFRTQEYNVHDASYFSKTICEFNTSKISFRNYFLNNKLDLEIDDSDLEIRDNVAYLYTELRMKLTHYVCYVALISRNQEKDDIILLLTIAFMSILSTCQKYKLEDLIVKDFSVLIQDNPFLGLKKHYKEDLGTNIVLESYEKALELLDKYTHYKTKSI